MPEEKEFEFEKEIPEEEIETKEEVTTDTGRKVKIDWFENNIWNGKTGYVTWEDPEDTSELGTVTVKITDFPTEDGFQEVEQNFERRHVVDYVEEESEPEFKEKEEFKVEEEVPADDEPFEEETPAEESIEDDSDLEPLTEEQEEEHECCICHRKFKGYGNNPWPIAIDGVCCDDCNWTKVIPVRIKGLHDLPSDIDFGEEEFEDCENCREHTSIPDDE